LSMIFYRNKISKDDAKKLARIFSLDSKYLVLSGMLKEEESFMIIQKITQNKLKSTPSEIDSDNLYDQLCCLINFAKSEELAGSNLSNFRIDDLKLLIRILLDTKSNQLQIEDSIENDILKLVLESI